MRFFLLTGMLFFQLATTAQYQATLLNKSYKANSSAKLKLFLDRWCKSSTPISSKNLNKQNDTVKMVYDLYTAFYQPKDLSPLGVPEGGNAAYAHADYLVIQDNINYAVVESLPSINGKDLPDYAKLNDISNSSKAVSKTVKNFRPLVDFEKTKILCLTEYYDSAINRFLKNKPVGKKGDSNNSMQEHDEKKEQFLSQYLVMVKRHWGQYWDIISYPEASQITFDRSLQYATINYRFSGKGGIAYYKKTDGKWILVGSRILYTQ